MILGLGTVIYPASDLSRARTWYQQVLGGIRAAAVKDPFGNRFGIIENPHFNASQIK